MQRIFTFGEQIEGYAVPVLNERAVRASAGLLFLAAIVAFMNAWLSGNFQPTRVFVVAFLFDFTIRIFINPRYAPSLIFGQWVVRKQQPEYVGAPQKRFAWGIGFALALTMFYLIVLHKIIGPINLLVCITCLTLLFFEAAFGICIGCKIYNLFHRKKARLCPGNTCDTTVARQPGVNLVQSFSLLMFLLLVAYATRWIYHAESQIPLASTSVAEAPLPAAVDPAEVERCKVPEFAIALGHEEKWKLHNNCK